MIQDFGKHHLTGTWKVTLTTALHVLIFVSHDKSFIKNLRSGEIMVQCLEAVATLPEDLGSISGTQMAVHNCLEIQFQGT